MLYIYNPDVPIAPNGGQIRSLDSGNSNAQNGSAMKKIAVGGINIEKIEAVIKSLVADNNIISGIPDVTNNTDVEVEMIGTGIKAELIDGYL